MQEPASHRGKPGGVACFATQSGPRYDEGLIAFDRHALRIVLLCRDKGLDADVAELDRLAVTGETEVARGPFLAGMRAVRHVLGDLAEIGI